MPDPQKPDPWQQAADEYKQGGNVHAVAAPESGNDDWKVWQDRGEPKPSFLRQTFPGMAANWDSNTESRPSDGTFGTAMHNFGGRAAKAFMAPLIHPVDTAVGMGKMLSAERMIPDDPLDNPLVQRIAEFSDEWKHDKPLAIENALGDAAGAGLQSGVIGAADVPLTKIGSGMRAAGAGIDNAVIGTPSSASRFGANPGSALSSNRIVGSTPASLAEGIQEKIPGAAAEHRGIVQQNQGGKMINTGPLISDPFEARMSAGTDPRTGAAAPTQIKAAGKTMRGLTHVPDEMTGEATPNMRDPNLSPLEATQLKSNLYPRINYEQPSRFSIANDSLRGAAHNLKEAVDTAVPESVEAGQRLHNLMSAKDIIEPSARSGKMLPTSKSGLIDRAAMLAGTGAGAGLDALGSELPKISRFLRPLPAVGMASRKD